MKKITWNSERNPILAVGRDAEGELWVAAQHYPGGHLGVATRIKATDVRTRQHLGVAFVPVCWMRDETVRLIRESISRDAAHRYGVWLQDVLAAWGRQAP